MSDSTYTCKFCSRLCKSKQSLIQHEIRCHQNPDRILCFGNKGNMPKHIQSVLNRKVVVGGNELNIAKRELLEYRKVVTACEICGRTVDEATKWVSKYRPKSLTIDHDHNTRTFRGLLCQSCNRQLGWFEKNYDKVVNYLNKSK